MKRLTLVITLLLWVSLDLMAQCAMCRATLENNVSNGQAGIAAGINFGILYLFIMPYLIVVVLGLLWYKKSRDNQRSVAK